MCADPPLSVRLRLGYCRGLTEQQFLSFLSHRRATGPWRPLLIGTHHRGARPHRLEPALEVRELVEVLLLALPRYDPGIGCHVGDRVVACNPVSTSEVTIEHSVEPVGFLDVALHCVADTLRRVLHEMMVLSGHRPKTAHLPENPL